MARYLGPPLLVLILLLSGASPAAAPVAASAATDAVQGDVNCDDSVNSIDSLQILRSVAGLSTSAACLADAGDVNCDDAVNSVDSLRILRYVAGLSNATPEGCAPIGEELEAGLNSYQLIQAALDAGEIDEETALTYKIFVTFDDPRLPAAYRGNDGETWDDPLAVTQAATTFDTLSPETQALLAPFLLPPDLPGSWQQLRAAAATGAVQAQTYTYLGVTTSPHVIVWYRQDRPQDQGLAQSLANEVDAKIWGDLTGLMGQPRPDTGRPGNYDSRIDVFLSGDNTRAYAQSIAPFCNDTSGFIVLGAPYSDEHVLTHELMHVINYHFPLSACWYDEYRWIHEATSQWSMDFVYPGAQKEWGGGRAVLKCFLDHPGLPVEHRNDCHEYGAYMFLFYLARFHSPQYVRVIWDDFANYDSLEGINAAVASLGGLKEVWPKFELQNYNRDPRDEYKDEDGIPVEAALEMNEAATLGGGHSREYVLRGDADHLAAFVHQFTFNDPAIREVRFKHSLTGQETAYVRALIKYEGDDVWKDENWTRDPEKRFCYDDPGQKKLEKLVIIISNSEYRNRSHILQSNPQPELTVRDQCAPVGTATGTYHWDEGYHEDWTVTADIEWVEDPDYLAGCSCRVFFPEGDIDWEWNLGWESDYSDPPCHETDSGHLQAGQGLSHPAEQWLVLWEDPQDPDQYAYSGNGFVPASWFSECENGEREGLTFFNIPTPDLNLPTPTLPPTPPVAAAATVPDCAEYFPRVARDATSIAGSCFAYSDASGNYEKYEWNFRLSSAAP